MTRMSIQLRRVVYLLVLLQCYVCLANAQGDGEGSEDRRRSEEENLEAGLRLAVDRAYDVFVYGSGCFSVWQEVVEVCRDRTGDVGTAVKGMDGSVQKIKQIVGKGSLTSSIDPAGLEEINGAVQKTNETMKTTIDAINNMTTSIMDTVWMADSCSIPINEWKGGEEKKFNETKNYFSELLGKKINETDERMILAINSSKIYEELTYLVGNLTAYKANSSFVARDTGVLQVVKTALEGAIAELGKLEEAVRDDSKGTYREVVELITHTKTAGDTKLKEIKQRLNRRLYTGRHKTPPADVKTKLEAAKNGEKLRLAVEMEAAVKTMVQEHERRKEAERQERERLAKLEEDRRLAKEQERMAQEELERKKMDEQEAEKRRIAEEAEKRKADEKRAQEEKAKQDQERKDAEEKAQRAREALEKKDKEQLERAAEEAKKKAEAAKKNDNSLSPALVYSPLLLLLLCVLVCTLVC